jgi:prepilin-type N-terminal cleavage/methylation domain-containing protein
MRRWSSRGLVARVRREDAFTLIELTIVVVILGIILTIATLSYANTNKALKMNAAKKQIGAAMSRAKTASRQENVSYQLIFYTNSNGVNPDTYEFLHNVKNEMDGTWTMTPVDRSVTGEEATQSGGHTYIKIGDKAKIAGCDEIAASAIVVLFTPEGTTMTVLGSDAGGVTTSATVTLNLQNGDQTGGVSITSKGTISSF